MLVLCRSLGGNLKAQATNGCTPFLLLLHEKILLVMLMAFVTNMSLVAKEPSQGFLNGAYAKMMAQSKMIDFAKNHTPIKSIVYYGSFTLCPSTGQNSSLSGTLTVYFYSNGVIKVDGEYYIPMEDSKEGTQGYLLPVGHKLQNVRAVSLLHNNTEINYLVALEMVIQEYGLYIIITCLLQVVLMDTTIILLPIMVAMVLLLELVQVVEVQEIVILAVEQVNIGKKLGNIQEIHIRRK